MSTDINLSSDVGVGNNRNGLKTKKAKRNLKHVAVKKTLSNRLIRRKFQATKGRGVVFVKHIPHGFYEKEMEKYFKQFGGVTRVRLSRSKRTGGSKGYGYVEFANEEVAKVAADAMKDYLMFRKRMMCEFVPKADLHPDVFKGCQRQFSKPKAAQIDIKRQNKPFINEKAAKLATKKLKSKNAKRMEKIAKLGVSYDLPAQS